MATSGRDWSQLPSELLGSVARRLGVTDYVRFSAVCTWWWSATSPREAVFLPSAPQLPWLLLPGLDGERDGSCTIATQFGGDRQRFRRILIPEMRGKWIVGSQDGWLALLDDLSEASLLNPLTRSHIHLPSVTTLHNVQPLYDDSISLAGYIHFHDIHDEPASYPLSDFRCVSFKKIVMPSRPTLDRWTAVALFGVTCNAAFATAGGDNWTLFSTRRAFSDVIYYDGKFLGVSDFGDLWILDPAGLSPQLTKMAEGWGIDVCGFDKYLVESSGDLLQVWYQYDRRPDDQLPTITFQVMKFDPAKAAWILLRNLGDRSLFLGSCYSMSLSARDISGLQPNCIYFTELLWDWIDEDDHESKMQNREVGIFSLEEGSFKRYHPPNPNLNWPPPVWFAPSLL